MTTLALLLVLARGVGLHQFTVIDPVSGKAMKAVAFYPTEAPTHATTFGPYVVDASDSVPVSPGRYPLIVFSHGSGGTRWENHDFMLALTQHGYVVATLDHPGDNFADNSGLGTDGVLIGRERQMSALIDAVLAAPALAAHIDTARIGAAGFSAGGYTALLLAGAVPRFDLLADYCKSYPHDPIFCTGWSVQIQHPELTAKRDPRVRAIFVMAPLGIYFDRASLAGVHVPVREFAAGSDSVLRLPGNADRVREDLPRPPEYTVIPHASHFIFLSPCTAAFAAKAPMICRDPPGVDRVAVHAEINTAAALFFNTALAMRRCSRLRRGPRRARTPGAR